MSNIKTIQHKFLPLAEPGTELRNLGEFSKMPPAV